MLNISTKLIETSAFIGAERFNLSDPQRYGLLQVRSGEAARKLLAHMDEMSWPHPTGIDWQGLREKNLIRRRPNGYHDLLPYGLAAATEIIRDLCRKFNVHVLTNYSGGRGLAPRGVCSCGTWSQTAMRNSSADSVIGASFNAHVERMGDDCGASARERSAALWTEIDRKFAEVRS